MVEDDDTGENGRKRWYALCRRRIHSGHCTYLTAWFGELSTGTSTLPEPFTGHAAHREVSAVHVGGPAWSDPGGVVATGLEVAVVASNHRRSLNARHKQILAVLNSAAEPLSTSAIRREANQGRATQLVAEQVYRSLCGLYSRGYIQRLTKDGTSEIYWAVCRS
ncbi:Uncharacterised protein [Mycolicibacterium vanbaalenii]|uniref:Uncharacterized protein n=2 Tax=Mycolicibacterium vanbaalenii TaxID=110539 RepID=A0A5S9R0N8_MYCVN|nr:Uncharacterised protein [Mycolicibacterium vanbaalenii]